MFFQITLKTFHFISSGFRQINDKNVVLMNSVITILHTKKDISLWGCHFPFYWYDLSGKRMKCEAKTGGEGARSKAKIFRNDYIGQFETPHFASLQTCKVFLFFVIWLLFQLSCGFCRCKFISKKDNHLLVPTILDFFYGKNANSWNI